jgi:hypothetical protein
MAGFGLVGAYSCHVLCSHGPFDCVIFISDNFEYLRERKLITFCTVEQMVLRLRIGYTDSVQLDVN